MDKKLYVFEPAENWSFCGGAIVIIATSWDEVVELGRAYKEEDDYPKPNFYAEPKYLPKNSDDCIDAWLLTGIFAVPHMEESRVVTYNYNYG